MTLLLRGRKLDIPHYLFYSYVDLYVYLYVYVYLSISLSVSTSISFSVSISYSGDNLFTGCSGQEWNQTGNLWVHGMTPNPLNHTR